MKIVLIALESYRDFGNEDDRRAAIYYDFIHTSIKSKISQLSQRITLLCQRLKTQHPDAVWIIGTREYFLAHKGNIFLTPDQAKMFKLSMQALTRQYPQLVIISGVTCKEEFSRKQSKDKLKQIAQFYKLNMDVALLELDNDQFSSYQVHLLILFSLMNEKPKRVNVVHNMALIFQNDRVYRHDKSAPWNETEDFFGDILENSVFQPAQAEYKNHCIELTHPITQEHFSVGIEICREYGLGLMQSRGEKAPLIQFVLSDGVDYVQEVEYGGCFFQIDGYESNRPQLVMLDPSGEQAEIKAYTNNVVDRHDNEIREVEVVYSRNFAKRGVSTLFQPVEAKEESENNVAPSQVVIESDEEQKRKALKRSPQE